MPIATPEIYAEMLDRAKANMFAYPAINITSSSTVTAAIQGFAEAGSDGIIQVSTGGAEYASGSTIKHMVTGAVALGETLGGRLVVAGLVQRHALPLRIAKPPRGLGRTLLFEQGLPLLITA